MSKSSDVINQVKKAYGNTVVSKGNEFPDVVRMQTGIFPLDLALGGGFPKGKIIEIFGPESSGKTNILLKLIATHQKVYPDQKCVFVNAEYTYDPTWAALMGVNTEELIVIEPQYAEQTVDVVEAFLQAEDVGLVGLDSIAAMVTANEIENSAEKAVVGGNSIIVNRLIKKSLMAMAKGASHGRYCSLVCINQVRTKIGVMYGDPETTPGGRALPFYASIRLRTYGKNIMENAISKTLPAFKEVSAVVRKWKVPILNTNSKFQMTMIPNGGAEIGDVQDWNTMLAYAKDFGMISKADKGWMFFGDEYKTLTEIREVVEGDEDLKRTFQAEIIQMAVSDIGLIDPQKDSQESPPEL